MAVSGVIVPIAAIVPALWAGAYDTGIICGGSITIVVSVILSVSCSSVFLGPVLFVAYGSWRG